MSSDSSSTATFDTSSTDTGDHINRSALNCNLNGPDVLMEDVTMGSTNSAEVPTGQTEKARAELYFENVPTKKGHHDEEERGMPSSRDNISMAKKISEEVLSRLLLPGQTRNVKKEGLISPSLRAGNNLPDKEVLELLKMRPPIEGPVMKRTESTRDNMAELSRNRISIRAMIDSDYDSDGKKASEKVLKEVDSNTGASHKFIDSFATKNGDRPVSLVHPSELLKSSSSSASGSPVPPCADKVNSMDLDHNSTVAPPRGLHSLGAYNEQGNPWQGQTVGNHLAELPPNLEALRQSLLQGLSSLPYLKGNANNMSSRSNTLQKQPRLLEPRPTTQYSLNLPNSLPLRQLAPQNMSLPDSAYPLSLKRRDLLEEGDVASRNAKRLLLAVDLDATQKSLENVSRRPPHAIDSGSSNVFHAFPSASPRTIIRPGNSGLFNRRASAVQASSSPVSLTKGHVSGTALNEHLSSMRTTRATKPIKMNYIHPELVNRELWQTFNAHTNEMIVTKTGRCFFPNIQFNVTFSRKEMHLYEGSASNSDALDEPETLGDPSNIFYYFGLVIRRISDNRFRWEDNGWVLKHSKEQQHHQHSSVHPLNFVNANIMSPLSTPSNPNVLVDASPNLNPEGCMNHAGQDETIYFVKEGPREPSYWESHGVSFLHFKVTNSDLDYAALSKQQFFDPYYTFLPLETQYKYQGVLQVYKVRLHQSHQSGDGYATMMPAGTLTDYEILEMDEHAFPELEFIVVTHYKNPAIIRLKKMFNPHAKGFRNSIPLSQSQSLPNNAEENDED